MSNVTQVADHPVTLPFTALTSSLVDVAAAVETHHHNTERRLHVRERELRHAQQGLARAQQWIVRLRRSHRCDSHAATGHLFKQALADLVAFASLPQIAGKE